MNIEMLDSEPGTALTVTARAALALGSDKARTELAALVLKSADIKEVRNAAGRDECHSAAMVLVAEQTAWAKEIERRNAEAKALEPVGTFTEPAPYIVDAVEAVKDLAPEYNDRDIRGACINLMYEQFGLMRDKAVARLAAIKWITEPATN